MATRVIDRGLHIVFLLCGVLLSIDASAYIEGEILPVGGSKMFTINIANADINSNQAGTVYPYNFNLGSQYAATIHCTQSSTEQDIYYTATASLTQAGKSVGYLRLNDYMDVKVEIFIAGNYNTYVAVPFNNISNKSGWNQCIPPTRTDADYTTGGVGRVTFMITKPIINGVNLRGAEVAKVYGRMGNFSGGMGSTPMAIISMNSAIITVPDRCVVNSGTPISVDFGTIPSSGSLLNGSNYSKSVPIRVKCEGGSFASGNMNIRLGIKQPNTASFNSDYLGTTGTVARSNLGIVLKNAIGNVVAANKFYDVEGFSNNQGTWNLTAAPIAKGGSDVREGDFQASAAVVAEFQ